MQLIWYYKCGQINTVGWEGERPLWKRICSCFVEWTQCIHQIVFYKTAYAYIYIYILLIFSAAVSFCQRFWSVTRSSVSSRKREAYVTPPRAQSHCRKSRLWGVHVWRDRGPWSTTRLNAQTLLDTWQNWSINTEWWPGGAHSAHISPTIYIINGWWRRTDHVLSGQSAHSPINSLNDTH